jgi:hypothetical protein
MRPEQAGTLTYLRYFQISGVNMHRIDTSTAQVDKFGAGKNGFTGGNPQTGELPTALDADFFDAVQEEIARVIEAAGLTLNKSNKSQLLVAMKTLVGPGRLLNIQTFIVSGTYIPTLGTRMAVVEVQGAGGGGGYARATAANNCAVGSGGGAGGYTKALLTTVPASQSFVVGKGGDQGVAGGNSSFGSLVATGGGGGGNADAQFADNTVRQFVGGIGGIGSGGIVNARGQHGGPAVTTTSGNLVGGAGGSSVFSSAQVPPSGGTGVGRPGTLGSGGSGAISSSSPASPFAGGIGGDGLIIVWEYA